MTDREAMQQALEALKLIDDAMPFPVAKLAMKNLRERLAHCDRCGKKLGGPDQIHTCSPQQEPVVGEYATCLEDGERVVITFVHPVGYGGNKTRTVVVARSDGTEEIFTLFQFAMLFKHVEKV